MNDQSTAAFLHALEIVGRLNKADRTRLHRAVSFSESTYHALDLSPSVMAEDQKFAASLGLDVRRTEKVSHEDAIEMILNEIRNVDLGSAFRAFVVGLQPKFAQWRTPLRALAAYAKIPKHESEPNKQFHELVCRECGFTKYGEWNSVGLALTIAAGSLGYGAAETVPVVASAAALHWFRQASAPAPSRQQITLFESVIEAIDTAPPATTASQLDAVLRPFLKGDKYSRRDIIETLALIGVLKNPRQPADFDRWTRWEQRDFGKHKNQEIIPLPAPGDGLTASTWQGFESGRNSSLIPNAVRESGTELF